MPMIYRNLIGKNHCSSGLIGMSDAGSGKQVKESKSSERKNTQMSLIFHLIFLCSVLLFYSCNNHEKYDFESSDEALNEYDNLYKTVRSQETCNAEQLASFINLWYECSDTVYKFIQKDPSFTAHAGLTMRFDSITDSIRTRLMELADNFTLSDVAYVKLHTSIYGQDKELDSLKRHATVFFSSLDSIPVYTGNIRDLLADYSEFLLSYKLHGVHSEDALLRFIRMEDFFFRSFLASIDECSALGMADITDMTANICDSIYKEASNGKIKADETITYMSMRTGRRLLLNAKVCHEKLKRGIVGFAICQCLLVDDVTTLSLDRCPCHNNADTGTDSAYDGYGKGLSGYHFQIRQQTLNRSGCDHKNTESANSIIHINHLII